VLLGRSWALLGAKRPPRVILEGPEGFQRGPGGVPEGSWRAPGGVLERSLEGY